MTERGVMLSKDGLFMDMTYEPLVSFQVPENYYHDLYKKVSQNDALYVIISRKEGKVRLFFYPRADKKNEFLAYVFFRKEDADKYADHLRKTSSEQKDSIVVLSGTALSLALSFNRAVSSERSSKNTSAYHVLSAIYLHGAFREMEYFWTDDKSKLT